MTTSTNSAFIRAYRDAANSNAVANQTDRADYVQRMVVSQLPEENSATDVEVSGTSHVGAVTLEDAAATETALRYRVDGADTVMPPRPHFTIDQDTPLTEEVAEEPVAMRPVAEISTAKSEPGQQLNQFLSTSKVASASLSVHYRPQWEVDRFRWSSVCDRLRASSSHRMVDVVQGLTVQAKSGHRSVAVTSYERGEGRTTVALNLARQAAESGLEVAVVDADLDNPSVARYTGVTFDACWNQLDPAKTIGEAGIVSIEDRFAIFPFAPTSSNTPERIIRDRANKVLDQLTQSFDMVILDLGPMFTAAHRWFRPNETPIAQSALIVRDTRNTDVQHVDDVCCRLIEVGIQNMAIIENFQTKR